MKKMTAEDIAYNRFRKRIQKDQLNDFASSKVEKAKKKLEMNNLNKVIQLVTNDGVAKHIEWDLEKYKEMSIKKFSANLDAIMSSYLFDVTHPKDYSYSILNTSISLDEHNTICQKLSKKTSAAILTNSKITINKEEFASPYQSMEVLKTNSIVVNHINNLTDSRLSYQESILNNNILKLLEFQKKTKRVKATKLYSKINSSLENKSIATNALKVSQDNRLGNQLI
jgi:hypothetical protein